MTNEEIEHALHVAEKALVQTVNAYIELVKAVQVNNKRLDRIERILAPKEIKK